MLSMANHRHVLFVLVLLTWLAPPLESQGSDPPEVDRGEILTITGKVVLCQLDGDPVAGAEIYLVRMNPSFYSMSYPS